MSDERKRTPEEGIEFLVESFGRIPPPLQLAVSAFLGVANFVAADTGPINVADIYAAVSAKHPDVGALWDAAQELYAKIQVEEPTDIESFVKRYAAEVWGAKPAGGL